MKNFLNLMDGDFMLLNKIKYKIKNIFKKEKLTHLQLLENEVEYFQNKLKESIPDSVGYNFTQLHLSVAMFKLALHKQFSTKE